MWCVMDIPFVLSASLAGTSGISYSVLAVVACSVW